MGHYADQREALYAEERRNAGNAELKNYKALEIHISTMFQYNKCNGYADKRLESLQQKMLEHVQAKLWSLRHYDKV